MNSCATVFLNISHKNPDDVAIILKPALAEGQEDVILTNSDLILSLNKGRIEIRDGIWLCVNLSFRNPNSWVKDRLDILSLLTLALPASTLLGALISYFIVDCNGWDAVFPSVTTTPLVWKIATWGTLISVVTHEHFIFWNGGYKNSSDSNIGLEIGIENGIAIKTNEKVPTCTVKKSPVEEENDQSFEVINPSQPSVVIASTKSSVSTLGRSAAPAPTPTPAPRESPPFRFIRATKGDIAAAKVRWNDTLKWREELGMDTILEEPHPKLTLIKENYPHYFHLRGRKNECCYYESPPKMNLKALKTAGIALDELLRHYALCCEYMWRKIETGEDGKSIYIIDLEGIGFRDFAGEVVDFVKKASSFTAAHYPERSGGIFVINVPSWFSVIWNVVRPMVDDVTKEKIVIIKCDKEAIKEALVERIPIENIPPEYGGSSMHLGSSPEEQGLKYHFASLGGEQDTE